MIKVKRLGHATIATPDIEAMVDYYGRLLGLAVVERSKDRVFLASKQGFEAIELVNGEKGQLKRLSFQIAPGTDLNDVVKELAKLLESRLVLGAGSDRLDAKFLVMGEDFVGDLGGFGRFVGPCGGRGGR